MLKVAHELRRYQETYDLSQSELAQMLGISKSSTCRYLQGHAPNDEHLSKISEFLLIPKDELLCDEDKARLLGINLLDFINLMASTGSLPPKFIIFSNEEAMNEYAVEGNLKTAGLLCVFQSDYKVPYSLKESVYSKQVLKFYAHDKNTILVQIDI